MNKSDEEKVSIVIPIYNAQDYIVETLDSALNQHYRNIEIICVDDCSTDNSLNVVESYISGSTQKNISLYKLPHNSGPSAARNFGITKANGAFILPLDADDLIDPSYIEKAVFILKSMPDADVVYSLAETFGAEIKPYNFPPFDSDLMAVQNLVFASAVFRKNDWKAVGGYNTNMRDGYEDWDFWLSFIEHKKNFYRINETLFYYRKLSSSRSTTALDKEKILFNTIKKNHPSLYNFRSLIANKKLRIYVTKEMRRQVKNLRKSIIHIRLGKNKFFLRIFGMTLFELKEKEYE